jgi:Pyridoxamine 5''-phosphate oxidase.
MAKQLDCIDEELVKWIARQRLFFVGTAPLSAEQHVNVSPKGGDSFRVLGPMEVAYQDYTGSGAETVAHLRENGRIVIMFCAFEGAPEIVRLHGRGTVLVPGDERFDALAARFPANAGMRAIIHVAVTRVSRSCGFSIPFFEYKGPRETLDKWAEKQGVEKVKAYRAEKNQVSIDGLPAFRGID